MKRVPWYIYRESQIIFQRAEGWPPLIYSKRKAHRDLILIDYVAWKDS